MILEDKGYELTLAKEEAEGLHKFTGNVTGDMTKKMGLTVEESEMMGALYEMLDMCLNGKQT